MSLDRCGPGYGGTMVILVDTEPGGFWACRCGILASSGGAFIYHGPDFVASWADSSVPVGIDIACRTMMWLSSPLVGLAIRTAVVVAKGVWASAHGMAAHAALVAAATALAALPTAIELEEAATARFALGGRHATAGGTRVLVVDDLGVVILEVAAWLLRAGGVDSR